MTDPVSRLVEAIDRKDARTPPRRGRRVGAYGIQELRVYCCEPRQGRPELAAAYPGPAS